MRIVENLQVACYFCNVLKENLYESLLIEFISRIYLWFFGWKNRESKHFIYTECFLRFLRFLTIVTVPALFRFLIFASGNAFLISFCSFAMLTSP